MPTPKRIAAAPSTFASRQAEREARQAAGEVEPARKHSGTFRAGIEAENPIITVTHA